MGKYTGGIMGNVTGSVGNIQGYSQHDKSIIRSRSIKRKSSDSYAAEVSRTKFKSILEFYKNAPHDFLDLISIYWQPQISMWHSLSTLKENMYYKGFPSYVAFWVVDGPIDIGTWAFKTYYPDEYLLQVEYNTAAGQPGNVADEDLLYYFFYSLKRGGYKYNMTGYPRGGGPTIDYYWYPTIDDDDFRVFNFWYRPSTKEFSKTFVFYPRVTDATSISP